MCRDSRDGVDSEGSIELQVRDRLVPFWCVARAAYVYLSLYACVVSECQRWMSVAAIEQGEVVDGEEGDCASEGGRSLESRLRDGRV